MKSLANLMLNPTVRKSAFPLLVPYKRFYQHKVVEQKNLKDRQFVEGLRKLLDLLGPRPTRWSA